MSYGSIPPHPAALVESLRALGYSMEAAVADLVDNCVSAGASVVDIVFEWNDGAPYATVLDNGRGMDAPALVEAMRLGGAGPFTVRSSDDLGRYGLGLKTASFSQARRLTVASKQSSNIVCARWDLDLMAAPDAGWELLSGPAPGSADRLKALEEHATGTMVLWESLCTGTEISLPQFLEGLERLELHLGMVFHRFIDGDHRSVAIKLNGKSVKAWDPFVTWHPATMSKPVARLRDASGAVEVRGHILPHRDRFQHSKEHERAGGPEGWVVQQGFYVYRAGRLIVAGGWLGLGGSREWLRDEASQLARIRIDIPNTCDNAWRIDVRKATARPPALLKNELIRIAIDVRRSARDVYAHRGVRGPTENGNGGVSVGMWRATNSRRYPYAIKRDHPAVRAVTDISSDLALVEAMLLAIERSIPVSSSVSRESPAPEEIDQLVLAAKLLLQNLKDLGLDHAAAAVRVSNSEPFNQVPGIEAHLQNQD